MAAMYQTPDQTTTQCGMGFSPAIYHRRYRGGNILKAAWKKIGKKALKKVAKKALPAAAKILKDVALGKLADPSQSAAQLAKKSIKKADLLKMLGAGKTRGGRKKKGTKKKKKTRQKGGGKKKKKAKKRSKKKKN